MKLGKILILALPFSLYAGILSNIKQKEFMYDTLKSIQNAKETKNSWINPVMLNYTFQKDNSQGYVNTSNTFSISINQPVFKSGAIYYSIKYAKLMKNYSLDQIELQKRALIKQALDLAYDYKINKINEKIVDYQIQNAKIALKRKKEDYLSGNSDSTDLDNAILNLNNLKLSLNDIKISQNNLKYSFMQISDLDINSVKLPHLKMINKNEYLNKNLELISQRKNSKISYYLYKMQEGNQLLTVSFNASYNYQQYKNRQSSDKNNYYTVGIGVSIPLDINAKPRIEQTKLAYLKSQTVMQDQKNQLLNRFENTIANIRLMKNKIKIYNQNIKIYNNLINSTMQSIKAGSATELDLEVLENSKKMLMLNKEIVMLDIQKLLLNLYYMIDTFKF